jgi:transposase InsO family protein
MPQGCCITTMALRLSAAACDFFVVITATFRTLYVFVIIDVGTRRILHQNVTAHPTAEWTLQQFREALPDDHPYRFVIHDRDSIFSNQLDKGVTDLGVRVFRTPVPAPMANSICERFGGTLRRECLDSMIPLNERVRFVFPSPRTWTSTQRIPVVPWIWRVLRPRFGEPVV